MISKGELSSSQLHVLLATPNMLHQIGDIGIAIAIGIPVAAL